MEKKKYQAPVVIVIDFLQEDNIAATGLSNVYVGVEEDSDL